MKVSVVSGVNSTSLCEHFSEQFHLPIAQIERKSFADGENYLRIVTDVSAVHIIATLYPQQERSLLDLLMLIDAAKRSKKKIQLTIPYLAYSRQDKQFLPGEPVTVDIILDTLRAAGIRKFTTVDCHFYREEGTHKRRGISIKNVSAYHLLLDHVTNKLANPAIVAPDLSMAKPLSKFGEVFAIEKSRDRKTGRLEVREKSYPVKGKDIVLIDDIISTGGTIIKAAELLSKQGASSITACCTHGLLVGNAAEKLREAGVSAIIATDSVESPFSTVTIAPLL